jgi:hypothetical protein
MTAAFQSVTSVDQLMSSTRSGFPEEVFHPQNYHSLDSLIKATDSKDAQVEAG